MAKKTVKKTTKKAATTKPPTKSEVFSQIAENTDLTKKDVSRVFDELQTIIGKSLKKHSAFTMPGLCKMVVKKKPAQKGGMRPNPFNPGEMMEVKPKPASKTVRIRPLKNLKEMV